jgi:hypothetical protein
MRSTLSGDYCWNWTFLNTQCKVQGGVRLCVGVRTAANQPNFQENEIRAESLTRKRQNLLGIWISQLTFAGNDRRIREQHLNIHTDFEGIIDQSAGGPNNLVFQVSNALASSPGEWASPERHFVSAMAEECEAVSWRLL